SSPGGAIGRRTGLKIPSRDSGVPVRVRPGAPSVQSRESRRIVIMPSRFAIALLLFASLASAQVRDTVDVTVTNVDLIVTDAKGKPVRGLTRDEFQLFEGNRSRDITNFSEVSAALPAPGA